MFELIPRQQVIKSAIDNWCHNHLQEILTKEVDLRRGERLDDLGRYLGQFDIG